MTDLNKVVIDESTGMPALPADHFWSVNEYTDDWSDGYAGYRLSIYKTESKEVEFEEFTKSFWPWMPPKKTTSIKTITFDTYLYGDRIIDCEIDKANRKAFVIRDSMPRASSSEQTARRKYEDANVKPVLLKTITAEDVRTNSLVIYAGFVKNQEKQRVMNEQRAAQEKAEEHSKTLVGKYPPLSLKDL